MMLVQVGLTATLNLIYLFTRVYFSFKPEPARYPQSVSFLIQEMMLLIFYVNYAKSFYIYTLSSHRFRSIFAQRFKLLVRMIPGRHVLGP